MIAALAATIALAVLPPVKVTVIGDSLALGVGASDSSNGFAFLLFKRLLAERAGSSVTNLAIGGAIVNDVVRLEVPRIAASSPDVVLVVVGANDVVHVRSHAAFAHDYATLIRSVRRAAPQAALVLVNIPDVGVSPIFDPRVQEGLERLAGDNNLVIAAQAKSSNALVVDFFSLTQKKRGDTRRFLSSDQFHPSDEGYEAIAAAAWPSIERAVSHRSTAP